MYTPELLNCENWKVSIISEYSTEADKTFISKEIWDNDKLVSIEVVGWYFGEPNDIDTQTYIGKLKATFEEDE